MTVLGTFADMNSKCPDVTEIVESARMALRQDLPGNKWWRFWVRRIGLSPEFEKAIAQWVWEQDGKRVLALPQQEAGRFLSAVRDHVAGRPARELALVVQERSLRPFARRLIAHEFPSLPVMAGREVEGMGPPSEQIKYARHLLEADT